MLGTVASRQRPVEFCPHCQESFPAGRPACPHCGSDAETGWSREGITGEAHGIPETFTEEDYDDVLRGIGALPPKQRYPTWIVVTAIIALIAFAVVFTL